MTVTQQILTVAAVVWRHACHSLPAVFGIPGRKADAEIHHLSRTRSAGRGVRNACHLLLKGRGRVHGQSWASRAYRHCGSRLGLHLWKKQMLLSIAGGTVLYMLLVQFVFV